MPKATIEERDGVAVLRLNNGVINAIGPDLLADLDEALKTVRRHFRGLVLTGGTKFFSMGFALPELLPLDQAAMVHFFSRFNDLCLDLLTLPLPTVCAVSGHAVAGGCILALTGDYRFAADGKAQMGLNEVLLGLPVPCLADLMLRHAVGQRAATDLVYRGRFVGVAEARGIGLIDGVFPPETLEERAVERAAELAGHPGDAFPLLKAGRVAWMRERYAQRRAEQDAAFMECWFTPPVQARLAEASKKF
jgi:enoyl-CoA hydratase/carnithine racemase